MSKAGWLIGMVLGGGTLAYLLWPRDAEASTEPLARAQQTMDERELQPTPAPKPTASKTAPAKKPTPKKTRAPKPMTVDEQLAEMRRVQQQYEVERDTAASMAMKEQIAQVLRAEIQKAEQAGDTTRRDKLRDQLAFMQH